MEDQEGVGVRGSRSCGHGLRLYRLSDVEEDDDMPRLPHSSHVYTYVNRYFWNCHNKFKFAYRIGKLVNQLICLIYLFNSLSVQHGASSKWRQHDEQQR